jgi:hypothetical protein
MRRRSQADRDFGSMDLASPFSMSKSLPFRRGREGGNLRGRSCDTLFVGRFDGSDQQRFTP